MFKCQGCSARVHRYLDTKDKTSTANIRTHVKNCSYFGHDVLETAERLSTFSDASEHVVKPHLEKKENRTITEFLKRAEGGKVTYSAHPHSPTAIRLVAYLMLMFKLISYALPGSRLCVG